MKYVRGPSMAFANLERSVIKFILQTYVKRMINVKKNIVTKAVFP